MTEAERKALDWLDRAYKKEYGAESQLSVSKLKGALDRLGELEEENAKLEGALKLSHKTIDRRTQDLNTSRERERKLIEVKKAAQQLVRFCGLCDESLETASSLGKLKKALKATP